MNQCNDTAARTLSTPGLVTSIGFGAPDDAGTRIENRIGEPAANPYLYLASKIHAGLDGIAKKMDLGPSDATPYEPKAEHLPATLAEALLHLKQDQILGTASGPPSSTTAARSRKPRSRAFT